MAMLAEKKKREKWCLNPRGNEWSNDPSKFGQRLLEKMGWSAGQGLGINKQGPTEIIKVRKKDDSKGLGFKKSGEEWLKTTSEFNELLEQLGNSIEKSTDLTEVSTSLEHRSKKSKARVHYHKFTRGKDLSLYSEKDLASIIGPEIIKSKNTENEMNTDYTRNQINKGNSQEYFNSKKRLNQHQLCEQDDHDKTSTHYYEEQIPPTNKKCKKSKKCKEHEELSLSSFAILSNEIKGAKSILNGIRRENTSNEFEESYDNEADLGNITEGTYNDSNQQLDISDKKSKQEKDKMKKKKSRHIEGNNEYGQNRIEGGYYSYFELGNKEEALADSEYLSTRKKVKESRNKGGELLSIQILENNCVDEEITEQGLNKKSKFVSQTNKKIINDNDSFLNEIEKNADYVVREQKEEKKRKKRSNNVCSEICENERDYYKSIENKRRANVDFNDNSESLSQKKKITYCNIVHENASPLIEENNLIDIEFKEQGKMSLNEKSKISSKKSKIIKNINNNTNIINNVKENSYYVYKNETKNGKSDTNKIEGDGYNSLNEEKNEKADVGLNDESELPSKKKNKKSSSNNRNPYSEMDENSGLDKKSKEQTYVSLNEESKISSKKKKFKKSVSNCENVEKKVEENSECINKEGNEKKNNFKSDENKTNSMEYLHIYLDVERGETTNLVLNDDSTFSSKKKKKKINNIGVDNEETASWIEANNIVDIEIKGRSKDGLDEDSEVSFKKDENKKSVNDDNNLIRKIENFIEYVSKEQKKEKKKRKGWEVGENIANEIETNAEVLNNETIFESESTEQCKKKKKKHRLNEEETISYRESESPVEDLKPTLKQSSLENILKKSKASEEENAHQETSEKQIQEPWRSKKKMRKEERLIEKDCEGLQSNETAIKNKQEKTSQESNKECLEVFGRRTRLRKVNIPLKTAQLTKYETADFMTLSTTDTKKESDILTIQNGIEGKLNLTKIYGSLSMEVCNLPKHVVAYEYRQLTDKLKEYNLVIPEMKIIIKDSKTITRAQHRKLKQLYKSRHIKTLLPKKEVKEVKKSVKRFASELKQKIDMINNLVKIEKKIAQLAEDLIEELDTCSTTATEMESTINLKLNQSETLENLSKELLQLFNNKANNPPVKTNLERKEENGLDPDIAKNTEEKISGKSSEQEVEEENMQLKHSLQTRIEEKFKVLMEQIKMLKEGKKPLLLSFKDRSVKNELERSIKLAEKSTNNHDEENQFSDHQYSFGRCSRGRGRGGPNNRGAHNSGSYRVSGILKNRNESYVRETLGSHGGFEGNVESFGPRTFGFRAGIVGNNNSYRQGTYGFHVGFERNSFGHRTFSFRGAPDSFRGRGRGLPVVRGRISKNNFDAKQYAEKCKELNTVPELSFKGVNLSKIIPGYAASKTNDDSNNIPNL